MRWSTSCRQVLRLQLLDDDDGGDGKVGAVLERERQLRCCYQGGRGGHHESNEEESSWVPAGLALWDQQQGQGQGQRVLVVGDSSGGMVVVMEAAGQGRVLRRLGKGRLR